MALELAWRRVTLSSTARHNKLFWLQYNWRTSCVLFIRMLLPPIFWYTQAHEITHQQKYQCSYTSFWLICYLKKPVTWMHKTYFRIFVCFQNVKATPVPQPEASNCCCCRHGCGCSSTKPAAIVVPVLVSVNRHTGKICSCRPCCHSCCGHSCSQPCYPCGQHWSSSG